MSRRTAARSSTRLSTRSRSCSPPGMRCCGPGGSWADRSRSLVAGHSLGEYAALVASGTSGSSRTPCRWCGFGRRRCRRRCPKGQGAIAAILGLDDAGDPRGVRRSRPGAGAGGGQLQRSRPGRDRGPPRGGAARDGAGQGARGEASDAAADERAISLQLDADGCRASGASGSRACLCSRPAIPVLNNVDVASPEQPDQIRDSLVRQLYHPVRWVECVQEMAAAGHAQVIECGPGGVLTGLNQAHRAGSRGGGAQGRRARCSELAEQLKS